MGPAEQNRFYNRHISVIANSYYQLLGKALPLCHPPNGLVDIRVACALYNAPFALISHGTENEPVFNYANRTAMALFNMSWGEITSLESRFSAEQPDRIQRAKLLYEVKTNGFIENYAGIRNAKGGRRFQIKNATVWNLFDGDGEYYGQAAMFSDWRFI